MSSPEATHGDVREPQADAEFLRYKALIFAFPGGVLAATADAYLQSVVVATIFVLAFLFIPIEALSSHLWEQVSRRAGRGESATDHIRETVLIVIDSVRASVLTLAIAMFPRLVVHEHGAGLAAAFVVLIAIFLGLNYFWNLVARPLEHTIRQIFDVYFEQIQLRGSGIEKAVGEVTRLLISLNRFWFFYLFPSLAASIIVTAVAVWLLGQHVAASVRSTSVR